MLSLSRCFLTFSPFSFSLPVNDVTAPSFPQVIGWLCSQGEEILTKHSSLADNLQAIQAQRQDFESLYLSALVSI